MPKHSKNPLASIACTAKLAARGKYLDVLGGRICWLSFDPKKRVHQYRVTDLVLVGFFVGIKAHMHARPASLGHGHDTDCQQA